jgi:glycosyltransferase involved in cell wall biosynthesis
MADFFAELARMRPNSHFLWLTGGPRSLIENLMSERGLNADQFTVCAARPLDVPMYLSAADVGIAFYKPALSRLATSPVKLAEYLACGLPVVINAGVGDSDTLISTERVGAVVRRFDETEYREVLSTILAMLDVEARQRSRKVAERFFDVRRVGVERYARLYEGLLDRAN